MTARDTSANFGFLLDGHDAVALSAENAFAADPNTKASHYFRQLRVSGNAAAYDVAGSHRQALDQLRAKQAMPRIDGSGDRR